MLGLEREDLKELSKEYEKVREFMSEIERVNENPEFRVYMTEEEDNELNYARMGNYGEDVDWLNAHHFDYRGLIEKGLALEAPEGMYD